VNFDASPVHWRGLSFYGLVLVAVVGFGVWDCLDLPQRLAGADAAVITLIAVRVGIEVLASFYVFSLVLKAILYPFNRRRLMRTAPDP
jgi:hypothetical protein